MNTKKYIKILVLAAAGLFAGKASAQTPANFVQTDVAKVSGATTDSLLYSLPAKNRQSTRVYIDGMGRTVQTIAIQSSPLKNDIIQPVAYDNAGRQLVSYLPYGGQSSDVMGSYRTNALTAQAAFYNNTSQHLIAADTAAHVRQSFESSPLQRLLAQGDVGTGYQPGGSGTQHNKRITYGPNAAANDGNIYMTGTTGTFSTSAYYADGTLWVTDIKDGDAHETREFTDLAGRVVLRRQITRNSNEPYFDTYYIYNNAGNISYIVPPKAVHLIIVNGYTLTSPQVANLIYAYSYNNLGLLFSKTVPNKGTTFIIYDPQNRPLLARDSNMAAKHQWYYIKYDVKDRPVTVGIFTDATHTSYSSMLSYVNSSYGATYWYESRTTTSTYQYYTNNVFPTSGTTPMSYNYYDNYDYNGDGVYDYSYKSQGLTGESTQATDSLKGMTTMTLKLVIGPGVSGTKWLMSTMFYDQYGHVIQTQTNNLLYFTDHVLTDTKTLVPDYTGKPLITKSTVVTGTASGTTNSVTTIFNYDSNNMRIASIDQVYNAQAPKRIAAYVYNEAGQLVLRKLDSLAGAWLQNVDYRYDIRGQMTSINNSKLTSDGGVTNSDSNDLFGMTLLYDQTDTNLPTDTASYSGLLTAIKWMSRDGSNNLTNERSYVYSYDKLERLTRANYNERTAAGTGAFSINTDGFDENGIAYDEAGNIMKLMRNTSSGVGATSHSQADNLTYTYDSTKPNQLNSISDAGSATLGFVTPNGTSGSYAYDNDGNLVTDPYKGLSLKYNSINRVDSVIQTQASKNGAYISYTYDASGSVVRKQVYSTSATLQTQTDYVGGYVYTTASGTTTLTYITNPEGRLMNTTGSTVTLTPEYVITDQQGNARFSFEDNGTGIVIRQENSFYAFGETYTSSTVTIPTTANKNLYNGGSEWQNDYSNLPDYQQTFFRNYDAEIGRFTGVDPVTEGTESLSVYQYSGNNPVMNNDPMGNKFVSYPQPIGPYGSAAFTMTLGHVPADLDNPYSADEGVYNFGGGGGDYSGFWGQLESVGFAYIKSVGPDVLVTLNSAEISGLYSTYLTSGTPTSVSAMIGAIENEDDVVQPIFGGDGLLHTGSRVGVIGTDATTTVGAYFKDSNGNPVTIGNDMSGAFWGVSGLGSKDYMSAQNDLNSLINMANSQGIVHGKLDQEALENAINVVDFGMGGANYINKTGTLEFLGKITGAINMANNMNKSLNEWHTNKLLSTYHMLEAAGQLGFSLLGGEEAEVLYNLGTMAIDVGIDYYHHTHNKGE